MGACWEKTGGTHRDCLGRKGNVYFGKKILEFCEEIWGILEEGLDLGVYLGLEEGG